MKHTNVVIRLPSKPHLNPNRNGFYIATLYFFPLYPLQAPSLYFNCSGEISIFYIRLQHCMFLLQMVALYRDPEGEDVLKSSMAGMTQSSFKQGLTNGNVSIIEGRSSTATFRLSGIREDDAETVFQLKKRIGELENELLSCQETKVLA